MNDAGGFSAAKFLTVCAIIGAIVAYWFYEASHFASGNMLHLDYRSFMPVSCTIGSDRAADTRQSAEVFFWQGNVRIDLVSRGEQKLIAHEIIKSSGTTYVWREDSNYGEVSTVTKRSPIFSGVAKENSWFCLPWPIPDFNKFNVPGTVTFE